MVAQQKDDFLQLLFPEGEGLVHEVQEVGFQEGFVVEKVARDDKYFGLFMLENGRQAVQQRQKAAVVAAFGD